MLNFFLRRIFFAVIHQYNRWIMSVHRIRFGKNMMVNGRLYINNKGTIEIGDNVTINSGQRFNPVGGQSITRLIVYPGAVLRIHDGAGISNSTIVVQSQVEIGRGAMIGGSCNIWDTDFHSREAAIRGTADDKGECIPIQIGEQAFIGAHSILLKGSRIGARAIVGAGSVGPLQVADDQVFVKR